MKGIAMKPYYSIEELAHILHDEIYKVADGLAACEVVPICDGKPADLSQWANLRPAYIGENEIVISTGECHIPDPSCVIVNSENLPQLWKDCINSEEQKNLLTSTEDAEQPDFDKASPTYPEELDYALQSWRDVSAAEAKGKPKARIIAWLNTNEITSKFSNEAKKRIATVANWDKRGGATRTD